MSGICGLLNFDGAKVEQKLLTELTKNLVYRGNDGSNIWLSDNIGFGHTLLKTTFESENETQPFTLDNQVHIIADARIDDRENLIAKLELNYQQNTTTPTDVELILRAYLKWGESFLDYLLGDFAFAIWDDEKQCLICARDHFGIKPFFYTKIGNTFIFASDIHTLKKYPNFSSQLNELAIADLLIFSLYQDETATIYQNVHRLAAAHKLTVKNENIQSKRYWQLPLNQEIHYQNKADYVANYRELFTIAVKDRLRFNKVNALMSGGMDSTAIAAIANQFSQVKAFTQTTKTLFDDEEKYYAEITAKHLGIDIEYFVQDEYKLYQKWPELMPNFSEPGCSPFIAASNDFTKLCLSHSPISLSGLGGDEVLYAHRLYYVELLKKGQILEFCRKVWQHWQNYGTFKGLAIRSGLKQLLGLNIDSSLEYPSWIKPEFTKKFDLNERFKHYTQPKPFLHKTHPEAHQGLMSSAWSFALESNSYPFGIEIRYPFFDLRLINYVLAIPPIPWCFGKHIHRASFQGILPDSIVYRQKTPLQGDPFWCRVNQFNDLDSLDLQLKLVASSYIDKKEYLRDLDNYKKSGIYNIYSLTNPLSLEYWLKANSF